MSDDNFRDNGMEIADRDDADGSRGRKPLSEQELLKKFPSFLTTEQWMTISRRLNLSDDGQELRVLRGVAAGLGDPAIKLAMGIAQGTLRQYLDRLFHKCGTRNRMGLVMRAMEVLIREKR